MSESQIAIAISIIPVLAAGFNVYVTLRMRAELAEFKNALLSRVREEFVPREVYQTDLRRIDERLAARDRA